MRPSILIIYTGGTIGMIKDPKTNALVPFTFKNVLKYIPLLRNFNGKLESYTFKNVIDSSNMNPGVWVELVKVIEKNYKKYDGFVVLHGSDTMAYTASALSFMIENLSKPIILTGSQLPIGLIRTDGRENLVTSLEIASAMTNNKPIIQEVAIFFENHLYRGNRTHKFNAENFGAFMSENYPTLADVGVHIRYNTPYLYKQNKKSVQFHISLNTNIAVLKLFPGINENTVQSILNIKGLKALILETFGAGNAPTDKWFITCLADAIMRGVIIYNVTQCKGGAVEPGLYETSVTLQKIGVIGGADITTEAAITKLMFLLGQDMSAAKIKQLLQLSIRGELTV